jgi:hypothetical protein
MGMVDGEEGIGETRGGLHAGIASMSVELGLEKFGSGSPITPIYKNISRAISEL